MLKCVIIDDEPPAIDVIAGYISKIPTLELAGTATNAVDGLELIRRCKADVVFLDIQMDEVNGIDVVKSIGHETKVIFCTAYSEFAVASYEVEAVDYIVKPVPFSRFIKAIQRLSNSVPAAQVAGVQNPVDYIFIKTEQKGKMVKIDLDDIDYIEGMNNYIAFHRGKEKILAYSTMKEVEDRLPKNLFMRVHKSYIVALKQIATVENSQLLMKNRAEKIPLGSNYKDLFMQRMQSHFLQP